MKKLLILLIVIALGVFIAMSWGKNSVAPTGDLSSDTSSAITRELDDIDVGDVGADFKAVDLDLNSL